MSRDLDAAIARAKGDILREQEGEYCVIRWADSELYVEALPHYSTDGNDMLQLDREMRERGWWLEECWYVPSKDATDYGWCAFYRDNNDNTGMFTGAETEPLGRALAAYKALTGKEWSEE